VETITDPTLDSWMDVDGNEIADKCEWIFDDMYTAANGGWANVHLGSRDFLIQVRGMNERGCSGTASSGREEGAR
jgi:hypothetical protein